MCGGRPAARFDSRCCSPLCHRSLLGSLSCCRHLHHCTCCNSNSSPVPGSICLLWETQEAFGPYLGKDAPLASTTALLVSTGIARDNLRHLVAGQNAYCVHCYAMSQRTHSHHVCLQSNDVYCHFLSDGIVGTLCKVGLREPICCIKILFVSLLDLHQPLRAFPSALS